MKSISEQKSLKKQTDSSIKINGLNELGVYRALARWYELNKQFISKFLKQNKEIGDNNTFFKIILNIFVYIYFEKFYPVRYIS